MSIYGTSLNRNYLKACNCSILSTRSIPGKTQFVIKSAKTEHNSTIQIFSVKHSNILDKCSATELEALGVVWAVKHFRHYLYGHRCHVFSDHEPLKSLLNTPHPSGKLAR